MTNYNTRTVWNQALQDAERECQRMTFGDAMAGVMFMVVCAALVIASIILGA